jgi:hypothetical protein
MYKLCEDISFHPQAPESGVDSISIESLEPDFMEYSPFGFGLGFFAAIAIEASGVTFDLNGFKIEQSAEHALMQRFFAIIELASAPFIRDAGPAEFVGDGEHFLSASEVTIRGPGTIGRSSHHGIHGNDNDKVTIENVKFVDFEVAAVARKYQLGHRSYFQCMQEGVGFLTFTCYLPSEQR